MCIMKFGLKIIDSEFSRKVIKLIMALIELAVQETYRRGRETGMVAIGEKSEKEIQGTD